MSSTYKNCPDCSSNQVVRNGFQSNRRVFKCKNCGRKFQSKSQKDRKFSSIVNDLTFKKNVIQI
jgi:transposase-like protein